MTVQEAITRKPFEQEVVSKEIILKYLASKKTPVDYNDFINNRLFKCPVSYARHWWRFYDKTGNKQVDIKNGRFVVGFGGERQSTGVFDSNGILLFDSDIVYHKQTNLFYVVRKKEKNTYLCREGKPYESCGAGILRYQSEYSLEDLVVSQDFKFVSSIRDESKFYDRYVLLYDTEKTMF